METRGWFRGWGGRRCANASLRPALAAAGLVLILGSVVLYDETTQFPGAAAIPPCLGAALLIATGREAPTVVHRVLQLRPLVVVGEISYSLYLWHWPIIVFVRMQRPALGPTDQLLVITASMVIAYLSWRFVEQPFRTPQARAHLRRTFAVATLVMTLAALIGLAIHVTSGAPQRFGISVAELAGMEELGEQSRAAVRRHKCYDGASDFEQKCIKVGPNVLVLGDSHADHLLPGLAHVFPRINFVAVSAGGCRPLLDVVTRANAPACEQLNRNRFSEIVTRHRFDAILLSAAWEERDRAALAETLSYLTSLNERVVVFGPIVQYRENVPMLLRTKGAPLDGFAANDAEAIDGVISEVAREQGVAYASVFRQLCGERPCVARVDDEPIQWDDEHLTTRGSEWVIDRLVAAGELDILQSIGTAQGQR